MNFTTMFDISVICQLNLINGENELHLGFITFFVIMRSPEGEECQHVTKRWKDTGTPWISRAAPSHRAGCPGLSQALAGQ